MTPRARPHSALLVLALLAPSIRAQEAPPADYVPPPDIPTAPLDLSAGSETSTENPAEGSPAPEPAPTPTAEPELSDSDLEELKDEETEKAEAPAPEAPPAAPSAPEETETASTATFDYDKYDPRRPRFELQRPAWGVQLSGSANGLGKDPLLLNETDENQIYKVGVELDFQPKFLQAIGVLGFGPSLAFYPITPRGTLTRQHAAFWSYGGQVRYQARWFREQPIVPVVGYQFHMVNYRYITGEYGRIKGMGKIFGAMFLLNVVEPSTAAEFYVEQGVLRTYLLAEYRSLAGGDDAVEFGGNTLFFGLRFEF